MSKKKAMPRSTMTLKDFHGGTIPSDLQLPSAPGMTVDRHSSTNVWASNSNSPMSSKGHRQPLLTAPNGARSYDFPNTASMGRNYDEDERRPVDFRPRTSPAAHRDHRYDVGGYFKDHFSPSPPFPPGGRFGQPPAAAPPTTPPDQHQPPLNVWAARRGERVEAADPSATSPWRVRNNMARIAEASAIDKVSSGRWQPATSDAFAPRKEAVYDDARKAETLAVSQVLGNQDVDGRTADQRLYASSWQSQPAEFGSHYRGNYNDVAKDDASGGARLNHERGSSFRRGNEHGFPSQGDTSSSLERDDAGTPRPSYDCLEVHYDRNTDVQPIENKQQLAGTGAHSDNAAFERETFGSSVVNRQMQRSADWDRNRTSANPDFIHQSSTHVSTMVGSTYSDSAKTGSALSRPSSGERPKLMLLPRSKLADEHDELPETGRQQQPEHDVHRTVERPKLSLKPRSQGTEVAGSEKERQTLFGGARPREMVLKERGSEEAPFMPFSPDVSDVERTKLEAREFETRQHVNRRDEDFTRSEPERYDTRRDSSRHDRKDHQDAKRDIDKQESWRRPVEPSPALSALAEVPPRAAGKAYGSSALQLAQAFSRSTTISAAGSRLMDTPSPRYGRAPTQQQRKHSAAATAW